MPGAVRGSTAARRDRHPRTLAEHRHHLLDVERVPSRRRRDAIARVLVQLDFAEQVRDEVVACVRAQRLEQERRRVQLPASPVRPNVEQLGARDAEEEDRRVPREVGDVLDEIDEHGLGPLEIVDHHDLRSLGGASLEQPAKATRVSSGMDATTLSGSMPSGTSISTSGQ